MHGHGKFAKSVETLLRRSGAGVAADLVKQYEGIFAHGMVSPDSDLANIKIPKTLVPKSLRGVASVAMPFWEHVIVPDCPELIEKFLREVVCDKFLNRKFMWADEALVVWYDLAIEKWREGEQGDAFWHLGRCCHLIQDVCVPHHTTVFGNLTEIYNLLAERNMAQYEYEKYCDEHYIISDGYFDLSEAYDMDLKKMIVSIANLSRQYIHLCDGIELPSWVKGAFLKKLFYMFSRKWKEKFDAVTEFSNMTADKYSTLLTYKFFDDVTIRGN